MNAAHLLFGFPPSLYQFLPRFSLASSALEERAANKKRALRSDEEKRSLNLINFPDKPRAKQQTKQKQRQRASAPEYRLLPLKSAAGRAPRTAGRSREINKQVDQSTTSSSVTFKARSNSLEAHPTSISSPPASSTGQVSWLLYQSTMRAAPASATNEALASACS